MCGKKNTSRCVQCPSVVYCGRGTCIVYFHSFVKEGYPDLFRRMPDGWLEKKHHATCRSLKGGSWHKIKVDSLGDQMPHCCIPRRLDPTKNSGNQHHGQRRSRVRWYPQFLAKFQISLAMDNTPLPQHILIYNRARSFQLIWHRGGNPKLFEQGWKMTGSKLTLVGTTTWELRIRDLPGSSASDRSSLVTWTLHSWFTSFWPSSFLYEPLKYILFL